MAMHHNTERGHDDGTTTPTGLPPSDRVGATSRGGLIGSRAIRGLMVGALVAGPLAVLTALPARAAAEDGSLFDRPLDVRVDVDGVLNRPPTIDLSRLGQVASSLADSLTPAGTTAGSGGGASTGGGASSGGGAGSGSSSGSGGSAGSGSSSGSGGGSAGGAAQPGGPAAPAGSAVDQPAPTTSPSEPSSAAADAPPGDLTAVDAAPASSTARPTASTGTLAGADGTHANAADLAIAHGSLLSPSDSTAIAALDVLAILLAGAGLIVAPATSIRNRRRA